MSQTRPWSVKGIDQRAREAAREAASAEGITLGEYLNRLLMASDTPPQPNQIDTARPRTPARPKPKAATSTLDQLTRRIEAVEARSTLAITGMDHTIMGLVAKLEEAENRTSATTGYVEGLIDELRDTHEALQAKVQRLENDESAKENLEALKALEQALAKLANHVYEENELAQNESMAIKGRVESGFADLSERVEGVETKVERSLSETAALVRKAVEEAEQRTGSTVNGLADRMSDLETHVNLRMATLDKSEERLAAVETDVSDALESMEGTLLRIQDRLNRAETTTDAALQSLESTFNSLDSRIDTLAKTVDPELAQKLRDEFEARFDDITRSVRETIDKARLELADEISRAATGQDGQVVSELKSGLEDVQKRLTESEERQTRSIETVTSQIGRLSESMDQRISDIEARTDVMASDIVREEIGQIGDMVSGRMEELTSKIDERVNESEQRSANAIAQFGEQVVSVATRLQARHDKALQALAEQIDENRKQTDSRLSDALSNVSERLEQMGEQTRNSLSPVQKAIASLATRLEGLENIGRSLPQNGTQAGAHGHEPGPTNTERVSFDDEDDLNAEFEHIEDEAFEPGLPEADDEDSFLRDQDVAGAETDDVFPEEPAEDHMEDLLADDEADLWDVFADEESPAASQTPYLSDFENLDEAEGDIAAEFDASPDASHEAIDDLADDPLTDLNELDDDHTEARDSDIFDTEEFDLDSEFQQAEAPDEQTSDYISMARRAALSMSSQNAAAPDSTRLGLARTDKFSRPSSKLPLYAAASAVAITGAAVGGYLYLRGKQPPAPITVETGAYVDPAAEAIAVSEEVAETHAAGQAEAELFGEAAPTPETMLFDEPAGEALAPPPEDQAGDLPQGGPLLLSADSTVTIEPAADFQPIPTVETVESAAAAGNRIAQFQLAQEKLSQGNLQEGASLMRRAAQKGLPIAQYTLAKLHEKGTGVPKDLTLAREWTEKAAVGGNVKAMHDLAVFMAEGEGGQQSYAGAVEWFRKAAEYGVVDSQYNLGVLYEQGLGISPSLTEALYWFSVAEKNGDAAAASRVAELTGRVSPETAAQALSRAESWQAADATAIANGRFGIQPWNIGNPLQVKAIQTALNALGYDAGAADGVAGAATVQAIRDYQSENGLEATGRITPELIDNLNALVTSQ